MCPLDLGGRLPPGQAIHRRISSPSSARHQQGRVGAWGQQPPPAGSWAGPRRQGGSHAAGARQRRASFGAVK